jgi:GTP-binding protein
MTKVRAQFFTSAAQPSDFPPPSLPEVAVVGRSNVGKSSLINALVGQPGLARTSRTPGRTRLVNWFAIEDRFHLVDLPGYGYAEVSHATREGWRPLIEGYLADRASLAGVLLLIDIRRGVQDEELDFVPWLAERAMPVVVALTKSDKLAKHKRVLEVARARQALALRKDPFAVSATSNDGIDPLWRAVVQLAIQARPAKSAKPAKPAKPAGRAVKPGTRIVTFGGYTVRVPANWPVYNLEKDPSRCVRYDVHAVYLGTPGPNQNCPPHVVGRVDTISILGKGDTHVHVEAWWAVPNKIPPINIRPKQPLRCVRVCSGSYLRHAFSLARHIASNQRTHISVSRLGQAWVGASSVVCPCIAEWGWSRQRVIGLVRRRAGLPVMSGEVSVRLDAAQSSPGPSA